jgi:hypothetical protein
MTVAMVALAGLSLMAGGDSMTWTGWISDSGCGVKGMSAAHNDCTVSCVRAKGAKYVFVNSATKQVIPIHNQDAVKDTDPGHEVKMTGNLMDDKSVHVESIAPAM